MAARKKVANKRRRALSTVVGGAFMVIVIAGALNVIVWTYQQQEQVAQVLLEKANSNIGKSDEGLHFSDIKVTNNKLNATISSEAGTAANLTALYIVNETSKQQYRYDMNVLVDGRNPVNNIGQSNPSFVIKDNIPYSVKVVSESGNTATARIKPVSQVALPMSLYVIPSTVTTLENVTLLLSVSNNLTKGDVLANPVNPVLIKTLSCSSGPGCQFTNYTSPSSAVIPAGGNTLFKWVFKVTAPAGTTMTFNATLTNAKQGNYVIEKGRVEIVQEALISSEVIVGNTLLQKPEVYLIAPGPYGEVSGTQRGYWGVVMINPIESDMKIKMVAINVFSSELSASHQIISSGCNIVGIRPNSAPDWSCPHDGIIRWQNLDNPITLKAYSAYTFLAKVVPGGVPTDDPAFMISVSVFTDFGQFSRQGYSSNIFNGNPAPIANIYLTDTSNTALANTDSHVLGNMTLTGGTLAKRMYVAIGEFENTNNVASKILSGTTVIINVPKGFQNIVLPTGATLTSLGFSSATTKGYSDGTTQIIAVTNEDIGDAVSGGVGTSETKVLYFDANVPSPTTTKAYAMHMFISGKANTSPNFPADAFSTIGLVVCPSAGCT
jgi:hypothetical protein